jgi:hypothetical protein
VQILQGAKILWMDLYNNNKFIVSHITCFE